MRAARIKQIPIQGSKARLEGPVTDGHQSRKSGGADSAVLYALLYLPLCFLLSFPVFPKLPRKEGPVWALVYDALYGILFLTCIVCIVRRKQLMSFIDKMYGSYEDKFSQARAALLLTMCYPGKKMLFMGTEYGQFSEWDHGKALEWFMLDYDMHAKLQLFHSELNHFYLDNPALWQNDSNWEGFDWIDPDNCEESVLSYRRIDREGNEVVVVVNFTPVTREGFTVGVSELCDYKEVFNSDSEKYGGSGVLNLENIEAVEIPTERTPYSVSITLPPHAHGYEALYSCKRCKQALLQCQ